MTNIEPEDSLRQLEIEQGFVTAFRAVWKLVKDNKLGKNEEVVVEEMQRWHRLYGEEYERLCTAMGIDFKKYEIE